MRQVLAKFWLIVLATVLLTAGPVIGDTPLPKKASASAISGIDEARLYRLFQIKKVGADIVMAVDTSLSMKESFPAVKKSLTGFVGALQANDRITLILFDNQARRVYRGPARGTRLKKSLPGQPNSEGQKTDIGEAVSRVLNELDAPGRRLPVVVFITDGKEEPVPGSQFAVRHDAAWQAVKDRATGRSAKEAIVHAIGLKQDTDIGLLARVWPQARPLALSEREMAVYFAGLKEKIRRERLKRELKRELQSGRITVEIDRADWGAVEPGIVKRWITVKSEYRRLPVIVDIGGANWVRFQGGGATAAGAARPGLSGADEKLILRPGESRRVGFSVEIPRGERGIKLMQNVDYRGLVRFKVKAAPAGAAAISRLGLRPTAPIKGERWNVSYSYPVGQSVYLFGAAALAAVAALSVVGRYVVGPAGRLVTRALAPPPLFGRLAFSGAPAGRPLPKPINLHGRGRRAVIGSAGDIRLPGPEIRERHAEVFTRWSAGERRVMVRGVDGGVRVAGSPRSTPRVIGKEVELAPGSVVEIGDYKMQWL